MTPEALRPQVCVSSSTATYVASDMIRADPFERVVKELYSVYLDMNREEVTATVILLGVAAVSVAGLGLVVINILQRCHVAGVQMYCWVTGCKSWLEIDGLEQRERAVKLERAK
ncbi:hypothetical protein FB446DRAFT_708709, partial [Lentinula raphanica]